MNLHLFVHMRLIHMFLLIFAACEVYLMRLTCSGSSWLQWVVFWIFISNLLPGDYKV